jgi:hypothetical protein
MDIVIDRAHEVQTDLGDLEELGKALQIGIPLSGLNQQLPLTFQMGDHMFGVACIHIIK